MFFVATFVSLVNCLNKFANCSKWIKYVFTIFRAALDIVECRLLILAEEACGLLAYKRLENGLTKIIYFDKVVFIC